MTKNGATPGEPGSVAWMFEQKGLIVVDLNGSSFDADEVMLTAIDAGAEDVEVDDGIMEIYTDWTQLNEVRQALVNHDLPITEADVTMKPQTMIDMENESDQGRVLRLLEKLEDLDDVQRVYSNLNITLQEEA
jgi:transcriptional/translational regulatory protein YebC/TACO1